MKVQLMLTCLGDALYGSVGIATVRVLESIGCEVVFPENQTCCGQPPFNAGHWPEAQRLAAHLRSTFDPALPIVTPSASCAAMIGHAYPQIDRGPTVECYELTDFLLAQGFRGRVRGLRRVALHTACHARALNRPESVTRLLESIEGVELVDFAEREQCCGFGGAFAVTHATLSAGIADAKLAALRASAPDEIVSTDLGCLMHLAGRAGAAEAPPIRHIAEFLAEVIQ